MNIYKVDCCAVGYPDIYDNFIIASLDEIEAKNIAKDLFVKNHDEECDVCSAEIMTQTDNGYHIVLAYCE